TWSEGACKTTDGENVNIGFDRRNFNPVTEATCKGKSYIVKTDDLTARIANLNIAYAGGGKWNGVNNFVCFGSSETPCPTDNLYRIIGVIDGKVKLIKYDYATSTLLGTDGDYGESSTPDSTYYKGSLTTIDQYYWNHKNDTSINDGSGSNIWSTSLLNKINLNTNFINNVGSTWANKIATTTWKVGGNTNILLSVPSVAYKNEIVTPAENTTYDAKIGLMYASDYYYAASPRAWTLVGCDFDEGKDYRDASANNWIYMGHNEWIVSRKSDNSNNAFFVVYFGFVLYSNVSGDAGVRPSFNLSSSITYVSGNGSMSNPIRIN
ncbi:MAG: hypothetical protein U0M92_04905, partial [Bacilli bacterium]